VKKLAESAKTQNAPIGNQRLAQTNFGRFQFFHSFSVTAGRDAALRRPDGAARRPYLSRPPSLTDYCRFFISVDGSREAF
jgi:hypothetical protein